MFDFRLGSIGSDRVFPARLKVEMNYEFKVWLIECNTEFRYEYVASAFSRGLCDLVPVFGRHQAHAKSAIVKVVYKEPICSSCDTV